MKKNIIILLLLTVSNCIYAQEVKVNNISKVIYKRSVYQDLEIKSKNPDVNKIGKHVSEIIKELEFELLFNTNSSIYHIVPNLKLEESPFYKLVAGTESIYYRKVDTKEFLKNVQTLGTPINVIMDYNKYNWIITKETKMFGEYKCYKATAIYKEFNPIHKSVSTFTPIVWFTPEIPVPFGPEGLDGLPGLVLEASLNGQTYYYASKIEINKYNNKDYTIEKPNAKSLSEDKYAKILNDRFN
ncbi:MAG: GLPGLI family protein [Gelidibacter sp.]